MRPAAPGVEIQAPASTCCPKPSDGSLPLYSVVQQPSIPSPHHSLPVNLCCLFPLLFPWLQAELGESTAALFTRDGEQANSLFDMQAMWYEVASGRAYLAQRQYGKVLCSSWCCIPMRAANRVHHALSGLEPAARFVFRLPFYFAPKPA